ncbi:YcaO-like family protein [Paucisalibacillus sp. EB02]|uniref:YcaO-like family protein n=1 Tax=Paucisalibacillus sp. EB02 TaxID=1347087 RepID=UPI0004BB1C57|nr:YcaO-like family protein [Paucisalibacillus sp. EB02]
MLASREKGLVTYEVNQFTVVAYESHKLGCIECVRKRIEDKGLYHTSSFMREMDQLDLKILEQLKQEVIKEEGHYYYAYNLLTKEINKLLMIKYPQCNVCAEEETIRLLEENAIIPTNDIMNYGYRTKSFDETIRVFLKDMDSFLHPLFGLFDTHSRNISDSMPLISLYVTLGRRKFDAHGRQETYKGSFFTALLEGLERFHGVAPPSTSGYYASEQYLAEQMEDFVSLYRFSHLPESLFSEEFVQVEQYSNNTDIFWRYAYSFNQKKYMLIPEEVIYFSTHDFYDKPHNKRYLLDSSNGIALGSNTIEAALGGIFEIIERDSFLVHWYSKSSPIKVEGITNLGNKNINLMIAYLQSIGYKVHIFDVTLESEVPSFWVLIELVEDDEEKIAFYTTAGTHINPEDAIESALVEASTSIRSFMMYQKRIYKGIDPTDFVEDYKKIEKLEDHLYLYSSPRMRFAFDFAIQTDLVMDAKELIKKRSTYLNRFSNQGELFDALITKLTKHHEIYQANLSSNTLKNLGLNCVKIIAPTMQNIGFGYLYQNINRDRIKQAVVLNGLNGETEVMNREPHPFP